MHPYLTRLVVPAAVQKYFSPYYHTDTYGNLLFSYGGESEVYGLGFHYIPTCGNLWLAGSDNLNLIRHIFICTSAMDAIAFLTFNQKRYPNLDQLLFVAIGLRPCMSQLNFISNQTVHLLFSKDLVGCITDLKAAAAIHGLPVMVALGQDTVSVRCRYRDYTFNGDNFSLNQFEKQSGQRFRCRTVKPRDAVSWAEQLFQLPAKKQ